MKKKLVLSVSVVLLLVMVALACVACTPSSDSVKKKLETEGYTVVVVEISSNLFDDIEGVDYKEMGVTKLLSATNTKNDEYVMILWFTDSKKLNEAYDEAKKELDELKEYYEENEEEEFNLKLVKKGKALIQGTESAVKLVG